MVLCNSSGGVFVANWHTYQLFHYTGTTPISIESLDPVITGGLTLDFDALTYSPDGSLFWENIAGTSTDWYYQKFDPATGALIANFSKGNFTALAFTPAVPEPSTAVLLLTLTSALAGRARTRQHRPPG